MTKQEQYYFAVLVHWYKHRPDQPPSIPDLCGLCRPRKSATAVRSALLSLESKGYCARNKDGYFEVVK